VDKLAWFFARWWRRALAIFLVLFMAFLIYVGDTIYHANFHIVVSGEIYRSGQMNEQQLAPVKAMASNLHTKFSARACFSRQRHF
jgi:hypothetical protein